MPRSPQARGEVFLSTSGSDDSCVRDDQARPCATFDRAYRIAHGGDTVVVSAGVYAEDAPNLGGNAIDPDPSKTGPVTFVCAGDGDVAFAGSVFNFWAGTSDVTVRGGCFHFHVVYIGEGGYPQRTRDITLDGVHMESFNIAGAANVTIENAEIGPFVACYMPGDGSGAPSYADCDRNDPAQAFWAKQGGTSHVQQEPFVHGGGAGVAANVALLHDRIHGITSKCSCTHTGGLLVWGTAGLTIEGSTFDHDAIYDIEWNAGSSDSNTTIENNVFGYPVYSQDPTEPDPGGELPNSYRELGIGTGPGTTDRNWLIRYNSIGHGLVTDGIPGTTYVDVRVVGNILGRSSTCGNHDPGLVFDHNVGIEGGTACGGLRLSGNPYTEYRAMRWQLVSGSAAIGYVPGVTADQRIATDITGHERTAPFTAGAYRGP